MKLIAIAGTNGSGKDTLGEVLAKEQGYLFVSVSDILRDELGRRGLPPAREHMRELSAEWRREYGLGVLVDKALERFKKGQYTGLIISPMRNPGEAQHVKDLGGKLVWVDADPRVRYNRIQANLHLRGERRSVDDKKSFQQFLAEEQVEMEHHGGDRYTLSMSDVKAISDIFITNDGNDLEAFKNAAQKALNLAR